MSDDNKISPLAPDGTVYLGHILPPLPNAKVIGLYFASSWDPLCKPATEFVKKLMAQVADTTRFHEGVHIVYISSDDNEEEFNEMIKTMNPPYANAKDHFSYVAFEDKKIRDKIKRLYSTCHEKEADGLGLSLDYNDDNDRKRMLPTLIICSRETSKIVSTAGISHMKMWGNDESIRLWTKWVKESEKNAEDARKKEERRKLLKGIGMEHLQ